MELFPKTSDKRKINDLLDTALVKKARYTLRAIDHPLRQNILFLLDKHGELSVTQIYKKMKMEQSETSQHLAILRRSAFVITRREGKKIYYSVNYQRLNEVQALARKIISLPAAAAVR